MYLLIPLILIGGSIAGIGYIVWPKLKAARTDDGPEIKESFWHLMFPELFRFLNSSQSKFRKFKENALVDYEKFLRRVKILSLKTDNMVNKLLEKRPRAKTEQKFDEPKEENRKDDVHFKNRESRLISEISKNPKDKNLYKALGALYLDSGMAGDAREAFSVVLELDPADLEAKEKIDKIVNLS